MFINIFNLFNLISINIISDAIFISQYLHRNYNFITIQTPGPIPPKSKVVRLSESLNNSAEDSASFTSRERGLPVHETQKIRCNKITQQNRLLIIVRI